MKRPRSLRCLLGFHKNILHNPETHLPVSYWVTVGHHYYSKCSRCGKQGEPFALTRDMLP